jgi:hypothetical protein
VSDNIFSDEFYNRWHHLLEDIDITDIPLSFVSEITVNMKNDEVVIFDITTMKSQKMLPKQIEIIVETFLQENDEDVGNIEFRINVKKVADTVTKQVSKLLDK